jgi:hypothetical protein
MSDESLRAKAKALNLHGLLANWDEAFAAGWAQRLLGWEEEERARRSLERRLKASHIGRFKPLCDFDWDWPKACDRTGIEALMQLGFLKEAANAVSRPLLLHCQIPPPSLRGFTPPVTSGAGNKILAIFEAVDFSHSLGLELRWDRQDAGHSGTLPPRGQKRSVKNRRQRVVCAAPITMQFCKAIRLAKNFWNEESHYQSAYLATGSHHPRCNPDNMPLFNSTPLRTATASRCVNAQPQGYGKPSPKAQRIA